MLQRTCPSQMQDTQEIHLGTVIAPMSATRYPISVLVSISQLCVMSETKQRNQCRNKLLAAQGTVTMVTQMWLLRKTDSLSEPRWQWLVSRVLTLHQPIRIHFYLLVHQQMDLMGKCLSMQGYQAAFKCMICNFQHIHYLYRTTYKIQNLTELACVSIILDLNCSYRLPIERLQVL